MDRRFMDKVVQTAWDTMPEGFKTTLLTDRKAPRNKLKITIDVEGQSVTFRATATDIMAYVHFEADLVFQGATRQANEE